MNFDEISSLRKHNPAWRLLQADNAPLMLSFFDKVFVEENIRSISAADLVSRLDDELYALNERLGEGTFPSRLRRTWMTGPRRRRAGCASTTRRGPTSPTST